MMSLWRAVVDVGAEIEKITKERRNNNDKGQYITTTKSLGVTSSFDPV